MYAYKLKIDVRHDPDVHKIILADSLCDAVEQGATYIPKQAVSYTVSVIGVVG